ncbi:MAG: hypothetical protein P8M11_13915 [Planctomycetota bacterium]|nr:hypothetical protein [Planctomycetota bacterium]MDG1985651.1 hypothetical protein [Planctomycetota bacterium]
MGPVQGIEALLEQLGTGSLAGSSKPDQEAFGRPSRAVPCGWPSIDRATGSAGGEAGLVRGCIHEWLGVGSRSHGKARTRADRSLHEWSPPLLLLAHLARQAVLDATSRSAPAAVTWIGRRVWPYPGAIEQEGRVAEAQQDRRSPLPTGELKVQLEPEAGGCESSTSERLPPEHSKLLERSIFIAPKDASLRLWSIDTALRCPGITAVIADGSGLGMAGTRRLQLAAASSEALVLLARPPGEDREVSAATTRWRVTRREAEPACAGNAPEVAPGGRHHSDPCRDPDPRGGPGWTATLLRAKGAQKLRQRQADTPRFVHGQGPGAG